MKATHQQDCPLCRDEAQYCFVDEKRRKHFLCGNCTQFQLDVKAEARLLGAAAEWRSRLSEMSKGHPRGATLVIALPATEAAARGDVSALAHEYVENSRLPS